MSDTCWKLNPALQSVAGAEVNPATLKVRATEVDLIHV